MKINDTVRGKGTEQVGQIVNIFEFVDTYIIKLKNGECTSYLGKDLELVSHCNYPNNIMKALRQRKGLEEDDTTQDTDINILSQNEVFEAILEWEGIIGYADKIKGWIKDIYNGNLE